MRALLGPALLLALAAAPARAATLDDANTTLGGAVIVDSSGRVTKPMNPYFIAGISGSGALGCTAGWNEVAFNVVGSGNAGSWLNTSNGRFTAPVNGAYLFISTIYTYPSGSGMNYVHYDIGVSGSQLTGGGRANPSHQLLGMNAANEGTYNTSLSAYRMFWLNAGQYASVWAYCDATGNLSPERSYSYFAGVLLQ